MKWLADQNVPAPLIAAMRDIGADVMSVAECSPGISDREVLALAQEAGRVLLTFDKDFGEIGRAAVVPNGFGIVLVRAEPGRPHTLRRFAVQLCSSDWRGSFNVVETARVRSRPLGSG